MLCESLCSHTLPFTWTHNEEKYTECDIVAKGDFIAIIITIVPGSHSDIRFE